MLTTLSRPEDITADDFRLALQNRQLSLVYQPIIELASGKPRGFEALMRWNHPEHGMISPGIFIPVAEKSGLIVEASRWALREACYAIRRIVGTIGFDAKLFISVNFSANDLADENFLEQLYTVISAVDINPAYVHVEITEALLQQQPDQARTTLSLCRRAGLNVAIDDFNTQSSSLDALHDFGVNIVKIDQLTDERVRTIIDDAKGLGMTTVAEGVETESDALMLREMGCQMAQGYFFAKPMPESDIIQYIRRWYR